MRRLFASVFVWVWFAGLAAAEPLTARAFSQIVAQAIQKKLPAATVTFTGELELAVKDAAGRDLIVSLVNAYKDYVGDPARLGPLVEAYAAGVAAPPTSAAKFDRSRIVPVIKDRPWIEDTRRDLLARGVAEPPARMVEDFNDHLVIVYAEDTPTRTRYLAASENLGVERAALRAFALAKLSSLLPKVELKSHPDGFFILSAGGDYDASLLLLDDIWTGGQIKVEGDIVVAVPANNALLVTGSKSRKGLKAVRALAAELAKGPHRLTDTLFVFRGGRFVKFGRN